MQKKETSREGKHGNFYVSGLPLTQASAAIKSHAESLMLHTIVR